MIDILESESSHSTLPNDSGVAPFYLGTAQSSTRTIEMTHSNSGAADLNGLSGLKSPGTTDQSYQDVNAF